MIGAGLAALLGHWRRRWGQGITLIAGLALATALWSGVQAINAEARAAYARAAAEVSAATMTAVVRDGGVSWDDFATLRRAGWLVTPVVEGRITLAGERVRLLGLDPLTAPAALLPRALAPGTTPGRGGPPLFAAPDLAARIGAEPVPGMAAGLVVTDITRAETLLGRTTPTRLLLTRDQPLRQPPLGSLGPYRLVAPQASADLSLLTGSFHLNLTAFGLLAFAVGLFVVHATIGLAFEERRAMFRTLRALGLPLGVLSSLLAAELGLVALIGGGIGMALGGLVAAALMPDVAASLSGLYGAEIAGGLSLRPEWWLAGLAMALGGTAVAGAAALLRLWRMPLLSPARPRAWARGAARWIGRGALGGGALLAAAAALFAFGRGLDLAFAATGGFLIGAALCLPWLIARLIALGARLARRPVPAWAWADTAQGLPGLSLALMALLLALSANLGVSTMVGSFRLTFLGWLDQRFAPELYVTARDEAEAARLRDWLAARGVRVLPIWEDRATVDGEPVEMFGVTDDPTYAESWPILAALPNPWAQVADGTAAVVNEQLARRLSLRPGDRISLPMGERIVAGIYSDYGNPFGQVLTDLPSFAAAFPEAPHLRHGLRVALADVPALREALTAEFGLPSDAIVDQAAIKAASRAIFERTFLVTGALNVLTLGVAAFALLTSLLTLSGLRLPQLAPVWALGLPRRHLARIELIRAAGLAAATFLVAIPVGLGLAWALLARVNVEAFGWRLPLHLFPGEIARLFVLSLLAAVLAAAWPALRLARKPPAEMLRVFSRER